MYVAVNQICVTMLLKYFSFINEYKKKPRAFLVCVDYIYDVGNISYQVYA